MPENVRSTNLHREIESAIGEQIQHAEAISAYPFIDNKVLKKTPPSLSLGRSFFQIVMDDYMDVLELHAVMAKNANPAFDEDRLPLDIYHEILQKREGRALSHEATKKQFLDAIKKKEETGVLGIGSSSPDHIKAFGHAGLLEGNDYANDMCYRWADFLNSVTDYYKSDEYLAVEEMERIGINNFEKAVAILKQNPGQFITSNRIVQKDVKKGGVDEITEETREAIDRDQQAYILAKSLKIAEGKAKEIREQLRKIKGEKPSDDEIPLAEKIELAGMPPEALKKAQKELKRLEEAQGPEAGVIRTYLNRLIEMPWNTASELNGDIGRTREVLDADHYGMTDVKKQIVKAVAVQNQTGKNSKNIICLIGPPGVGKTSIARSIAAATGRKYVRMALGGVDDEAEIRGHSSTYIGAKPGKIVDLMTKAGTKNPLFLLDEIDKLGSHAVKGSPKDALLEVLDPEQNCNFTDHYLDVEYDLSHVMFVCTANYEDQIPPALKDRMQVIRLPGYTHEEKMQIAKRYLISKQMAEKGLNDSTFSITDGALELLVQGYTKEAGVRNLEREIGGLCSTAVLDIQERKATKLAPQKFEVTAENLKDHAGPPKVVDKKESLKDRVGLVKGLYWSEAGGGVLPLEAALQPGKEFNLTLSGSLKEVMTESAQNASKLIRTLKLTDRFNKEARVEDVAVHINAPNQATPKDGPSAGAALATLLVSVATNTPIRGDLAMTGELGLHGDVTPIGGLREKLDGARRDGIKTVLIPKDNEKDLADVPQAIKDALEIIPVATIEEVLDLALVHKPGEHILKPLPAPAFK